MMEQDSKLDIKEDQNDPLDSEYRGQIREEQKALYAQILSERDAWIRHRSALGVEQRWKTARDLYYGTDEFQTPLEQRLANGQALRTESGQPRSKIVVNIVRPKCDQAIARFSEILLPVDDKCWGIKTTPVAQTVQTMLGNPSPTVVPGTSEPTGLTAHDEATFVMQAADEACKAMEARIDDALNECSYNGEQRLMIEDYVVLGTGIMEGPYLRKQTSKTWMVQPNGQAAMIEVEQIMPAARRRDPYDVWFDPSAGNDHQKGLGVWDRRRVTKRELYDLMGVPGYDTEAIKEVLRQSPTSTSTVEGRVTRVSSADKSYELFTYHGFVDPQEFQLSAEFTDQELPDEMDFGVLMFVNDTCIGAIESWVPDKSLPFSVMNWRRTEDSPWGLGLPHEMEHQQRVVIAAWRQIMDHARTVSGNQIVYKRKQIIPVNGQKVITPDKLWEATDDVEDVSKAFSAIQFTSRIPDLMAIAKAAMEFVDHETSMPQLLAGAQGSAPETVGGMIMLFQTASTVLRMRMKRYDDCVTRPLIARFYDYYMANDPDMSIKGDFEVDARGATALLERDITNQAALNLANITSNPRYQPFLDPEKELDTILKALKMQPKDLKLSADKIAQNKNNPPEAPPDPRIVAAQLTLEGKKLDMQDREAQRQADQQRDMAENQIKQQQLQYNQAREQADWELQTSKMTIDRDSTLLKIDQQAQQSREALAAKRELELLSLDTKRQLFNAEADLKLRTGQGI